MEFKLFKNKNSILITISVIVISNLHANNNCMLECENAYYNMYEMTYNELDTCNNSCPSNGSAYLTYYELYDYNYISDDSLDIPDIIDDENNYYNNEIDTINIKTGWNFIGFDNDKSFASDSVLSDNTKVDLIWQYNNAKKTWAVYSPNIETKSLIEQNGLTFKSDLDKSSGAWLLAKGDFSYIKSSKNHSLTNDDITLYQGWNLLSSVDNNNFSISHNIFTNNNLIWVYRENAWYLKHNLSNINTIGINELTNINKNEAFWVYNTNGLPSEEVNDYITIFNNLNEDSTISSLIKIDKDNYIYENNEYNEIIIISNGEEIHIGVYDSKISYLYTEEFYANVSYLSDYGYWIDYLSYYSDDNYEEISFYLENGVPIQDSISDMFNYKVLKKGFFDILQGAGKGTNPDKECSEYSELSSEMVDDCTAELIQNANAPISTVLSIVSTLSDAITDASDTIKSKINNIKDKVNNIKDKVNNIISNTENEETTTLVENFNYMQSDIVINDSSTFIEDFNNDEIDFKEKYSIESKTVVNNNSQDLNNNSSNNTDNNNQQSINDKTWYQPKMSIENCYKYTELDKEQDFIDENLNGRYDYSQKSCDLNWQQATNYCSSIGGSLPKLEDIWEHDQSGGKFNQITDSYWTSTLVTDNYAYKDNAYVYAPVLDTNWSNISKDSYGFELGTVCIGADSGFNENESILSGSVTNFIASDDKDKQISFSWDKDPYAKYFELYEYIVEDDRYIKIAQTTNNFYQIKYTEQKEAKFGVKVCTSNACSGLSIDNGQTKINQNYGDVYIEYIPPSTLDKPKNDIYYTGDWTVVQALKGSNVIDHFENNMESDWKDDKILLTGTASFEHINHQTLDTAINLLKHHTVLQNVNGQVTASEPDYYSFTAVDGEISIQVENGSFEGKGNIKYEVIGIDDGGVKAENITNFYKGERELESVAANYDFDASREKLYYKTIPGKKYFISVSTDHNGIADQQGVDFDQSTYAITYYDRKSYASYHISIDNNMGGTYKDDNGVTWTSGVKYRIFQTSCENLVYAGVDNWRTPTAEESKLSNTKECVLDK
jgi:hypothetical protein